MTEPKRINIGFLLAAALIVVVIVFDVAYGDDDHKCQGGHNCNGGGDTVIGDTIVGGDDVLGVGFSMGDVDLSNAYGSKSTPVFQWLKELPWGMANDLDAMGNHAAAAKVRCLTKTLKKAYPDKTECEAAVLMTAPPPRPPVSENDSDEDDGRVDQLYALVAELEAGYQQQMQRPPPQVVIDPAIQEGIDAGARRRAKAREALHGEE